MKRQTYVAFGRLAAREIRLDAARHGRHGVQVITFEQLAARLAGGFAQGIDVDTLRETIQQVLPQTELGELDGIKTLPGMIGAAADTLHKVWRTGIDLTARASEHPRLGALAALEHAVLQRLPNSMHRPVDLAARARDRLRHASALFGEISLVGMSELSPCWRDLLFELAASVSVRWFAGPRLTPPWLEGSVIEIVRSPATAPQVNSVSAASAYHEALEAYRWARELITSGAAKPFEIAIAAAAPAAYDDEFMALRADANIDLHFVHGVRVVATRDGQTAAALADVVVRGLTQGRLRRLAAMLSTSPGPFESLPQGWRRFLPGDANLSSLDAWRRLLSGLRAEDWPDGSDHGDELRAIVESLSEGAADAEGMGRSFLPAGPLRIWNKALLAGSAAAIDVTIDQLRQDDDCEACTSIAWMPASALAASPRRFVRLLGLTSTSWPRGISEDRLLSDHIVSTVELDPLPVAAADRRDFETILNTTTEQIVLSRARRDSDGRVLGKSPLLRGHSPETYLRRNRRPAHAVSEVDRLLARPNEFAEYEQALSAAQCWSDWRRSMLTAHDGLIRENHPAIASALGRVQSANSLSKLLRDPLAFTWRYALKVRPTETGDDLFVLDARQSGNLLHEVLDHAVRRLESQGSLATADHDQLCAAIADAAVVVSERWQSEEGVPPKVVWRRTIDDARATALNALTHPEPPLAGQRSYTEVPFGGQRTKSDGPLPWDPAQEVEIAGAGFRIAGFIDRLDLAGDGAYARVFDYKGGKLPKDPVVLQGGKELQRCLYAYAVQVLLGDGIAIDAALLYPRDSEARHLEEPASTLATLSGYLRTSRTSLLAGRALIGPDAGGDYDDLSFALPANAVNGYCPRKQTPVLEALGEAAVVWEAE